MLIILSLYQVLHNRYVFCCNRFPHIKPGKQKQVGDHFLAIFPTSSSSSSDHSAAAVAAQKIGSSYSSSSGGMESKCPIDITSCPEIRNDLLNLPDLLLSQLQQQQQQQQSNEENPANIDVHRRPSTTTNSNGNSKTKINRGTGKSDQHYSSSVDTPPTMIPTTKEQGAGGGGFNMNELDKQYYAAIRSHPQYRKQRKTQFFRWLSKYEE